ncbi:MAG: hypothetical protein JNL59_06580 [Chitinophagaceae bacterium]|nr:hypothetical protein [Chitinophagaceae bacterium]
MDTQHSMEERLWEYIDGQGNAEERTVIEQLIAADAAWRAKYGELLEVHQLINSSELEEPSMRFTRNVMDEIARMQIAPATQSYINKNIIRGLSIFFVTMIIGFLIYGFGQIDWTAKNDPKMNIDLSAIDYSKFFNNNLVNAFMMLNVILGLFLLDRYLANKRKKFSEEM